MHWVVGFYGKEGCISTCVYVEAFKMWQPCCASVVQLVFGVMQASKQISPV